MGQHDDVKSAYCMLMRRKGLKRKSFMTVKKYYMSNKKSERFTQEVFKGKI